MSEGKELGTPSTPTSAVPAAEPPRSSVPRPFADVCKRLLTAGAAICALMLTLVVAWKTRALSIQTEQENSRTMAFLYRVQNPGNAVAFPETFLRDTLLKPAIESIKPLLCSQRIEGKLFAVTLLSCLVEGRPEPALLAYRGHAYDLVGRHDSCIEDCETAIKQAPPGDTGAAIRLYAHTYEGMTLSESGDSPRIRGDTTLHKRLYRQALAHYNAALLDDLADVFQSMNTRYLRERVREPRGESAQAVAMASPPPVAIVIFTAGMIMGLAVIALELDGWRRGKRTSGVGGRKRRGRG
jgi:hypothetical protein